MKKFMKISTFLTYLTLPLSLIATNIPGMEATNADIEEAFENQSIEANFSLVNRNHRGRKNSPVINSVFFPAFVLDQNDDSGAFFEDQFSDSLTIPVIGLPETDSPEFTLGFTVPFDCIGTRTVFHIQFITASAISPITGNIKLIAQVETARRGDTLTGELSSFGTGRVPNITSATPTLSGNSPANYYVTRIVADQNLRQGDFVYLTFTRDNSISNNFASDIFITGAELIKLGKRR